MSVSKTKIWMRLAYAVIATTTGTLVISCGSESEAIDRGFVQAMVEHDHRSRALGGIGLMVAAELQPVREIAAEVVVATRRNQTRLEQLKQELRPVRSDLDSLGLNKSKRGSDISIKQLKRLDPFVRAYLYENIRHQKGALRVAQVELQRGKHPAARRLAATITKERQKLLGRLLRIRQRQGRG